MSRRATPFAPADAGWQKSHVPVLVHLQRNGHWQAPADRDRGYDGCAKLICILSRLWADPNSCSHRLIALTHLTCLLSEGIPEPLGSGGRRYQLHAAADVSANASTAEAGYSSVKDDAVITRQVDQSERGFD